MVEYMQKEYAWAHKQNIFARPFEARRGAGRGYLLAARRKTDIKIQNKYKIYQEVFMKLENIITKRAHKTIYRDGDKAIKVFEANYSKADILNEALNQARVEETGLNIPKILSVTTIDEKWAIISEFIEGKTLDMLMKENPDKTDEYLNLFVDLQREVHSKRAPGLSKLRDKMNRKIDEADLDAAIKYNLHARLAGMPKRIKVCHGDFNPSNIIIRESDGTPFILDWSHATQGNAAADAARTYLLFCLADEKELAEKYRELFCRKNDSPPEYFQKWLPIVAASQSVKGKPEERDFLISWADVVDYE